MPVIFVENSMVMTTFLGAGYSTWRADTANSVFGQFNGHNSGIYRTWSRYNAHQHIHQVWWLTWWKLFDLEIGNPVEAARLPTRRRCSHNTSCFSNGRIKKGKAPGNIICTDKIAGSGVFKLFDNGNKICHTTDAPKCMSTEPYLQM